MNIEDITGLEEELASKAPVNHTHSTSEVDGLVEALAGKALADHNHSISEVTGLTSALSGKSNEGHTHELVDVNGLADALANRSPISHTHTVAQVTGLDSVLAGKADENHSHPASEIDDLSALLAEKANTTHSHGVSEITGLQTVLDQKAALTHPHAINDVTGLQDTLTAFQTQVANLTGSIQNVLGLQSSFDTLESALGSVDAILDRFVQVEDFDQSLSLKSNVGHTHTLTAIEDTGEFGRTLAAAADQAAARVALGLSDDPINSVVSSQIRDASAVGRSLLTARDVSAQKTLLGIGGAAALEAPIGGDALPNELVTGSDSRLTDPRVPLDHRHSVYDLDGESATTGDVLVWDGESWVPRAVVGVSSAILSDGSVDKIVVVTATAYAALTEKDPKTLYFVK